ncbi:rubrerythrin [Desulfobacter hydrogenophilus]|uniref:Rubrerythrin n=1 Tax=Desulfobacter hydrogenophilus TaxID=2291 RepID=A0A328F8C5_9BACT|nr:ferritin family protein [Desulfobacter hydrogenophilus]NDY73663.1 ferritin family protein [Desulfobacter hydrogenophilus]QBH14939.1 rubrerythrin [Desulfobacter hydrogenophilus]RAM00599.1 rubrerythrin [Desulfobacter hydrogenophilus]
MKFKSVDEILEFAIDRENAAVALYTSCAQEATSKELKQTFLAFAKEEEKHAAMLSDISGNKAKIDSYEFKKIPDLKISDYMVDSVYEKGMPMPDVLKLAMKNEEKAVKLYQLLADQTDNSDAKKLFLLLAQEESKHKLGLESMYDDYLADMDG